MCKIYLLVCPTCTSLPAGSFPQGIPVSKLGKSSPLPETTAKYPVLKRLYITQESLGNRRQGVEACRDAPQNYPVQGRSEEGGNGGNGRKWVSVSNPMECPSGTVYFSETECEVHAQEIILCQQRSRAITRAEGRIPGMPFRHPLAGYSSSDPLRDPWAGTMQGEGRDIERLDIVLDENPRQGSRGERLIDAGEEYWDKMERTEDEEFTRGEAHRYRMNYEDRRRRRMLENQRRAAWHTAVDRRGGEKQVKERRGRLKALDRVRWGEWEGPANKRQNEEDPDRREQRRRVDNWTDSVPSWAEGEGVENPNAATNPSGITGNFSSSGEELTLPTLSFQSKIASAKDLGKKYPVGKQGMGIVARYGNIIGMSALGGVFGPPNPYVPGGGARGALERMGMGGGAAGSGGRYGMGMRNVRQEGVKEGQKRQRDSSPEPYLDTNPKRFRPFMGGVPFEGRGKEEAGEEDDGKESSPRPEL